MIYMDNASTTYVYPECILEIEEILNKHWGNPSNTYTFGQESKEIIENSKKILADLINASPEEIFFTSGASEGNALAINQSFTTFCSPFEHHNYLDNPHTEIIEDDKVLSFGDFGPDGAYAHMLVSNETGEEFLYVPKFFEYVKSKGGLTICDCTQAFGHMRIDIKEIGCDIAIFSGHKFHAPKGIGFVYINKEIQSKIHPIIFGTQQKGLRGGTENVPYIAALATAAKKTMDNFPSTHLTCGLLTAVAYRRLNHYIENEDLPVFFTFPLLKDWTVSTFHFCLKNVESELIQSVLSSDYNICIGIGSGCSDGSFEVNKTLKAKGVPEEFIRGPIRLSFSDKNTEEEVVEVIDKIVEVYHKVKQSASKD